MADCVDADSAAADHNETAVAACDDRSVADCVDADSGAADHNETAVAACGDLSAMTIASRSCAAAYCCCWSCGVLDVSQNDVQSGRGLGWILWHHWIWIFCH